jgi:hypothetical protein
VERREEGLPMTTEEILIEEMDRQEDLANAICRRSVTLRFELDVAMHVNCAVDGWGSVIIESAVWNNGEVVLPEHYDSLGLARRVNEVLNERGE